MSRKALSKKDRLVLLEKQDNKCGYCTEQLSCLNFHIDHLIPVSCGGGNQKDNLICACPNCHSVKTHYIDCLIRKIISNGLNYVSRNWIIEAVQHFLKLYSDNNYDVEDVEMDEDPLTTSSLRYDVKDRHHVCIFEVEENYDENIAGSLFYRLYQSSLRKMGYNSHQRYGKGRICLCFRCGFLTTGPSLKLFSYHLNSNVPCVPRFLDISRYEMVINYEKYFSDLNLIEEIRSNVYNCDVPSYCEVMEDDLKPITCGIESNCDFTTDDKRILEKHKQLHH